MTTLTLEQRALLQRYYDGDVGDELTRRRVERLLEESGEARGFLSALEELSEAVRLADEEAWGLAMPPDAARLAELAADAVAMSEAPISELAPLLERFHDGETDPAEAAMVVSLIDARDDVADYLAELDSLSLGVRAGAESAGEAIDFGAFWGGIEERLDFEDGADSFDREEHTALLHRYRDGEVDEEERARVEGWLEAGDEEVAGTLAALETIELAVRGAVDEAGERAELGAIWAGVEARLEAEKSGKVVTLPERRTRGEASVYGWRPAAVGAIAALLCVALLGGIFGEQLFGGGKERVIVREKTVVIVDSVEYAPGASVMINSPMQQASLNTSSLSAPADGEAEEEEPTVIWLLDSGEGELDDGPTMEPVDDDPDAGRGYRGGQPI